MSRVCPASAPRQSRERASPGQADRPGTRALGRPRNPVSHTLPANHPVFGATAVVRPAHRPQGTCLPPSGERKPRAGTARPRLPRTIFQNHLLDARLSPLPACLLGAAGRGKFINHRFPDSPHPDPYPDSSADSFPPSSARFFKHPSPGAPPARRPHGPSPGQSPPPAGALTLPVPTAPTAAPAQTAHRGSPSASISEAHGFKPLGCQP